MQGSTARWRRLRLRVLNRDGWTCAYCGAEATHVDHVTPTSKGGAIYDETNLVAACQRCNLSKGAKTNSVFLRGRNTLSLCPRVSIPPETSHVWPSPFDSAKGVSN